MNYVSISGLLLRLLLLVVGLTSIAFSFLIFGQARLRTPPIMVSDTTLPGSTIDGYISAAPDGSLLLLLDQDFQNDAPPDAIYLREFFPRHIGGNWSALQRLPADSSRYAQNPRGLKDQSGIVHAFWGERFAPLSRFPTQPPTDIMYSYRDRTGKWSQPISLFHSSDVFPWSDLWRFPEIRRDAQDRIHLIWPAQDPTGWPVYYKRKDGNGWTETKKLPFQAANVDFTIDSEGRIYLAMTDPRLEVWYTFSNDAAQTWSLPPVKVASRSPGQNTSRPRILVGRDKRIHILWALDSNGDVIPDKILLSHSPDGVHWSQPFYLASLTEEITWEMIPVIDALGNIHLFFHGIRFPPFQLPHKLYYVRWNTKFWTPPRLLLEEASLRSVAIDSSQSIHLIWGRPIIYSPAPRDYRWISYYSSVGFITSTEILPQPIREFQLLQNYPNPFNSSTRIEYHLPQSSPVTLEVYDTAGRLVRRLVNGDQPVGVHQVTFDGGELASGTYIYQLKAGNFTESRRMLLLK